ncbi:MAG: SulP family inorganic anion transporter [Phycisphaerae bacterium]|nr:SulP family inorganic anion transporter [Phycisphaerae bacterium]
MGKVNIGKDFVASIVVFLVALPLCIGIAQACGLPAQTGLVTGVIGGLIVGLFAGSPLQVSGPAAGLVVIVVDILEYHEGNLAIFGAIVVLAGALQLVAGALKLGQWFRAVSPAVIQGMLAGIGILIFSDQFHVMLDRESPGKGLDAIVAIPAAFVDGISIWNFDQHHQAAAIGLITIISIVVWPLVAPKPLKILPGALIGVVLASVAAATTYFDVAPIVLEGDLLESLTFPDFSVVGSSAVLIAAVTVALVASAETLLCASAVDQMHTGPRTKYNQELSAQGVGNMLCGFVGALPMTGVIVRSSANVNAGATSRWSAVIHGAWLLIFVALLSSVLLFIPRAALAGVLVYTGWKLVNIKAIRKLSKVGRGELAIYIATVVGVVAIDLLSGVIIGVGLSLARLLYKLGRLQIKQREERGGEGVLRIFFELHGAATVIALPRLARELEAAPAGSEVHLSLADLDYIDHACLNLIGDWERQHQATGGTLVIDWEELRARYRPSSRASGALEPKSGPPAPVAS